MQQAGVAQSVAAYGHWIGGKDHAPSSGDSFPSYNPTTGAVWGEFALGEQERRRGGRGGGEGGVRQVARDLADAARTAAHALGRRDPRECREDRPDRDLAERQAPQRDGAPGADRPRLALLLRRPRRQDRGQGHPARPHLGAQLHAPRAARRGRRDHAVELAAVPDDHGGGAGARRGQYRGDQAVGGDAGLGDRGGAARRGGRHPGRRDQCRHRRPRHRRGAGRPSRRRQDRLYRRGRGRPRQSAPAPPRASPISRWSSAARAPTSSSPTPT